MRFLILLIALTSQLALAQNLQDVIYKKDGTELRGSLIEQDFEKGKYKIQLAGGSVFNVSSEEIEKITKEKPLNSARSQIVKNSSQNSVSDQATTNQPNPYLQAYYNRTKKDPFDHVILIASLGKSIKTDDGYGVHYDGISLAYQYNYNKNIAVYTEYGRAKLDAFIDDGDHYDTDDNGNKFTSTRVAGLFSSNLYNGWQFYSGLGLFNETFSNNSGSSSAFGPTLMFGLGYSWRKIQTHLRFSIDESNDYADDVSGLTIDFQVGYNF